MDDPGEELHARIMVNVDDAAGMIYVAMLMNPPLTAGAGSLLEIDFRVVANAAPGVTSIDLQSLSLNEGQLALTVVPVNGADPTDGILTIQPLVTRESRVAEIQPLALLRGQVPASHGNVDFSYLGRAIDQLDDHGHNEFAAVGGGDDENGSGDWFRKLARGRKSLKPGSGLR